MEFAHFCVVFGQNVGVVSVIAARCHATVDGGTALEFSGVTVCSVSSVSPNAKSMFVSRYKSLRSLLTRFSELFHCATCW